MGDPEPRSRDHTARRLAGLHVRKAVDEHMDATRHIRADGILMVVGAGALALVIATIFAIIYSW